MGKKRKSTLAGAPAIDPFEWAEAYLSQDELKRLQESMRLAMPISIRINCLKSDPKEMIASLASRYGWEYEAVPFCESGFWIRSAETAPSSTIEHRLGYFYIQEAASMLPAALFDFKRDSQPLILDMAASPGGKAIHLIDIIQDRGLVIANDASRSRIPALRVVLRNWSAANQAVTCQPGEWFGFALPEIFDAVLLDAPCSMQGLRISPSHTSHPITENEIAVLAERQINLLVSALYCVKVGGQVVYSTCTLSPQENEGVLAEVMQRFGRTIEIVDIQERLGRRARGIGQISGKPLPDAVQHAARLWPHIFNTAGFFSAKLIKKQALGAGSDKIPETFINDMRKLKESEAGVIFDSIGDQYGLDLRRITQDLSLAMVETGGKFFLGSERLLTLGKSMPLLAFGIPLGKPLPHGWQPSHTLVSRFGDQFTRGIFALNDRYLAQWARGEDIRGISGTSITPGSVVVVRDAAGRNLGRGKVLKDRLKNQLPTRLF